MSKDTLVPVSYWAVGRLPETSQVAIKLNDLPPIHMSAENAREIAAALKSEAHASTVARLMKAPERSARTLKTQPLADNASPARHVRGKVKR
jgi:hypothetical protein